MRRREQILIAALGVVLAGAPSAFWLVTAADTSATVRVANPGTDVVLAKDADLISGVVPARTTIADLFDTHLIAPGDGTPLVASIAAAMDVRRLRAGQPYLLDRLLDGRVRRFDYELDNDRVLVVRRASFDGAPRFVATIDRIPKHIAVVAVEGEINRETNSLVASLDQAGERIELALGMADVFSGEIDFNADLQPGDRFRVLVERHTREGKLSGYGPILAAEFVNDGRTLKALRFTPDGGSPGY